jgi:5,10-methylenetetrahydromethanopterin reductase
MTRHIPEARSDRARTHSPSITSLGVVFPAHAPPETLPAFAERAEERGYEEVWVVEDCFLSGGLTMATAALAATERIRVGVGLLPAAVRNAAIAAMELATIARIYPGRLTVAFGHGVETWMTQIGARPQKRLAALGEVVTAVRMLLAGETVNVSGSFVSLASVTLENPPQVAPGILVGTTGSQGIALAGRRAEGLLLPEGCGPRFVAHAKQIAEAAARPAPPPQIVAYAWLRIDDDEPARRVLSDAVAHWAASGLYPEPMRQAGLVEAPSPSRPISRHTADEVAVVGSAARCVEAVERFSDAGAQRLVMAAIGNDADEQYARFAREVLPMFRGAGS